MRLPPGTSCSAASATWVASSRVRRASRTEPTEEPTATTGPAGSPPSRPASADIRRRVAEKASSEACSSCWVPSEISRPTPSSSSAPTRAESRAARAAPAASSVKSRSRAWASSAAGIGPRRCRSTTPTSRRPSSGTPSAWARSAASETVRAWVRMPESRVRWVCRSRDSRSRTTSRLSASADAPRSSSMVCGWASPSGSGPGSWTRTSRPQSWPRAPMTVTSQPLRGSCPVRPSGRTPRERRSQSSSTSASGRPAVSWASTWWARFSRTTGAPAIRATWRITSGGSAPSTTSSLNTWWTDSETRSCSSWALTTRACTASVTATKRSSRRSVISGSPRCSAAFTRARGSASK